MLYKVQYFIKLTIYFHPLSVADDDDDDDDDCVYISHAFSTGPQNNLLVLHISLN